MQGACPCQSITLAPFILVCRRIEYRKPSRGFRCELNGDPNSSGNCTVVYVAHDFLAFEILAVGLHAGKEGVMRLKFP